MERGGTGAPRRWAELRRHASRIEGPKLERWVARHEWLGLADRSTLPHPARRRRAASIAAIEHSEAWLRARLGGRVSQLRNRARLERLLLLVLLDLADQASETAYAEAIIDALADAGGRPALARRAVAAPELA